MPRRPRSARAISVASAGKIKGLRGAKLGNAYLRWAFGEAAVLAKRHNSHIAALAEHLERFVPANLRHRFADLDELWAMAVETGIAVCWVPRIGLLDDLLAAPTTDERMDVLVENFKPGTLEKWGIGPDELLDRADF